MSRIEELMQSQARVRSAFHRGDIDEAIREYDDSIRPALGAVDPRVRRFAWRLSKSFIQMAS